MSEKSPLKLLLYNSCLSLYYFQETEHNPSKHVLIKPKQLLNNEFKAILGNQPNPIIEDGFETNLLSTGRPNDNDLAISDDGWIVSVVNSHIHMQNINDSSEEVEVTSLFAFAEALDNYSQAYDPKVQYDPESGKFMLTFLNGYTANKTNIVMGFSISGDPRGIWFLYEIEGNPFEADDLWSDYPMISVSDNEVFVTINQILENVSWQEGFVETFIWQFEKDKAFKGQELDTKLWYDIKFEDKPIRNIIPVEGGFGATEGDQLFLSNRNFAEQNDTIFILNISNNETDTTLSVNYGITDLPYTMPPSGREPEDRKLQTNDARILGASVENNKVHFVCNTENIETGFAEVYHGIITEPFSESPIINGKIIGNEIHDFAYPNLAFCGQKPEDEQYIIAFSYSSPDDFPGVAAIFYQDEEYSDIIFIKEGLGTIFYPGGGGNYRWGDYSGIQYKYDEPGIVWLSNTFGDTGGASETWVAKLSSPNKTDTIAEPATSIANINQFKGSVSPNPVIDIFTVEFEAPASDVYSMELYDATGKLVKNLLKAKVTKGANRFLFSTNPLNTGLYILKMNNVNNPKASFDKKVIVQ